jgi:hypothetical protein
MAITYPRPLPAFLKTDKSRLELLRFVAPSRGKGPKVYTKQYAAPVWQFTLQSTNMTFAQSEEMAAWFDSLRGGGKGFLARDYKQPEMLAYPNGVTALTRAGGGAFDATAKLGALAINSLTVGAVGGFLPAALQFKAGDKVGVVTAGAPTRRMIYRVVEDAVASGGGVAVLNVEPAVTLNIFAAGDVVRVVKPEVECVLEQQGWSPDESLDRASISILAQSKAW